jgi:hypothetical protein
VFVIDRERARHTHPRTEREMLPLNRIIPPESLKSGLFNPLFNPLFEASRACMKALCVSICA